MQHNITTIINSKKCTGCGLCVKVCPSDAISLEKGKAVVTGDRSIGCGHCLAVCPVNAVQVGSIDPEALSFKTFSVAGSDTTSSGTVGTVQLVELMSMRRSCRNFNSDEVSRDILEDLVRIGITAPSGTNSQKWTFSVLSTRDSVKVFGSLVVSFYKRLNRLAGKYLLRNILKLVGKDELDNYYRNFYESVKEAVIEYEESGRDQLFHGARAVIIVGSEPGGSCPMEDALFATENILLAAETMGLGTCLIGFAVEAIKHDRSIQKALNIPGKETIHAVIALGYPSITYKRPSGRRKPVTRFLEL